MMQPDIKKSFKQDRSKVITIEKGKLPPQAIDIEEVVLGALMIDKKAVYEVIDILKPEVFYKEAHQHIFEAIIQLFENNEPIDLLTVSTQLKENSKLELSGGDFYLISITQKVSSSAHIEYHSRLLQQYYVKRESIKVASKIIEQAYEEETDIFDLLSDSQRDMDNVSQWLIRKKPVEFKNIVDTIFEDKEQEDGLPSKLESVQKETNGFTEPDVIIVAARPGMGKTAYMLNEAKHKAKQGIPVAIFSLEMSSKQLTERMLAEECGIDSKTIKNRKWNDFERRLMEKNRVEFEKLPIYIHDQGGLTPMEFKLQLGKWKREKGVKMAFIDYLQLMNASGKNVTGNREQEISYISRSIKGTAKELEMPIMALSQLSRAVESRGGMKRPLLSDLRESGAIEQDADVVIFLLRPEYYRIMEWDDDERSSTIGQCELSFAKHRGGEVFSVVVRSQLEYMRFEDLPEPEGWLPQQLPSVDAKEAFEQPNNYPDEEDDLPF